LGLRLFRIFVTLPKPVGQVPVDRRRALVAALIDSKISHSDLVSFGQERVNLPREQVDAYREQASNLRDRLERHIDLNPKFDLVKVRESGSLPKGTALRSASDMDLAVYVKRAAAPERTPDLIAWMLGLLRGAYSFLDPSQFSCDDTAVRISYRGSGIDVEMVPVLYDGDADDYGELILRTGKRVRTSIKKHIEFIRTRKSRYSTNFAQVARLLKYWRNVQARSTNLPLTSFSMELLLAHAVDNGISPTNYPVALESFFAMIVKGGLRERISFSDNYAASALPRARAGVVEIFDPVNAANNVAADWTGTDRSAIVEAAHDALDDVTLARTAPTKQAALAAWRSLFGPEFNV
jgi:hypothetical protein